MPIHSFEPGGVERVALRLAERWRQGGENVVVVVLGRARGRCRDDAPPLDYRTRREPIATDRWETLWLIWSLWRFLARERVDVLFCAGSTYTIVCVAMKLLLRGGCPPVLVKISNDVERTDLPVAARPLYRLWLRIQGLLLDHFVALAEPMQPQVVGLLGITPDRCSVIPDPALSDADLARLSSQPRESAPATGCRMLSVGRLVAQKDHALLVEAFAREAGPADTLVIAGDGPMRSELERLIARKRLSNRITLLGHVADVPAMLAASDIFVLSSRYEGLPAVVVEALAAGLPVATTDCCASMIWLMQDGAFGIAVAGRDPQVLGLAMNAAARIDPPREAMRRFAARFTLEQSAPLYLAELHRLARPPAAPTS